MQQARVVALVTGASRGIGRAIALRMARDGALVSLSFHQNREGAFGVVEAIKKDGGSAIAVRADVADQHQVEMLVDETVKAYGRVDVLINNAGAIVRPGSWDQIAEVDWQRTIDVNLKGVLNCTRASAPHMRPGSAVVNIASTTGGLRAAPAVIAYGAAKAGVISLTRSFAVALAPEPPPRRERLGRGAPADGRIRPVRRGLVERVNELFSLSHESSRQR